MGYQGVAGIFKGLAASGSWGCFDEFNSIDLEVLSVVAQQVQSIQYAIEKKSERFVFEECDIPIKHTCYAFITINPGRNDSLMTLIRPL